MKRPTFLEGVAIALGASLLGSLCYSILTATFGGGEVLRLGPPPYRGKFLTFLSLREDLSARCPSAEHFDLRFSARIYAKQCSPEMPAMGEPTTGGR